MIREELTVLYKTEFKIKEYILTKDMFCLQAVLGYRVGDFLRLTIIYKTINCFISPIKQQISQLKWSSRYQAGEPIHVVASMSGHSENSKAFDRYRRRPEQLQRQAVGRSMD